MNLRKVFLIGLTLASLFIFISCGSPSDPASPTSNPPADTGGSYDAGPIIMVGISGGPVNKITTGPNIYVIPEGQTSAFSNATADNPIIVDSFLMAQTETTYAKWYEVCKWATDSARGSGVYSFGNPGREGDDGKDGTVPTEGNLEPVTNISWRDAIVWCNAASEKEGLIPVYWLEGTVSFTDSSKVLRKAETLAQAGQGSALAEKAVVNPHANGYRLPSEKEWEFAARGGRPLQSTWDRPYQIAVDEAELNYYCVYKNNGNGHTAPVKSKNSNVFGLYDINGNVAEMCINQDAQYGIIRGGSYNEEAVNCTNTYRKTTFFHRASNSVGFRTVRSLTYMDMVLLTGATVSSVPAEVPTDPSSDDYDRWKGAFSQANNQSVVVASFRIGATELTYEKWYEVYQWATDSARGSYKYKFANPGREGNDGSVGAPPTPGNHEPVTDISWRDAVVWCNALSEMEGLTPYYWLEETTDFSINNSINVLRISESASIPTDEGKAEKAVFYTMSNGYRLPLETEWEFAARGGDPTKPEWNYQYIGTNTIGNLANFEVLGLDINSDSTCNVASKAANGAGCYDMGGNVTEWCQEKYSDTAIQHVCRGGTYFTNASVCRPNTRAFVYPEISSNGFRVAQNVPAAN